MSDVNDLISEWKATLERRNAAPTPKIANREFDKLGPLHRRILSAGDEAVDAFAELLHDPAESVQIAAAAALLPYRPQAAEAVLERYAPRSTTAKYTLREWRAGTLRF